MENNKITDNELKIDINILKSEISKINISYDELNNCQNEISSCINACKMSSILIICLVLSMFIVNPIIPGIISLIINYRKNQIKKHKTILQDKLYELNRKINLANVELILKKTEIGFKENILDYRNGEKISDSKIKNLNLFSSLYPEFTYEIQEINDKYNYIPNPVLPIFDGNQWRFIPILEGNETNAEIINEIVLRK